MLVNTVRDNRKDRNVRKDPRLALAIADPENPYRYLSIRGEVIERREDGARDYPDGLAERYTGTSGQQRVVFVTRADEVSGQSPPSRSR